MRGDIVKAVFFMPLFGFRLPLSGRLQMPIVNLDAAGAVPVAALPARTDTVDRHPLSPKSFLRRLRYSMLCRQAESWERAARCPRKTSVCRRDRKRPGCRNVPYSIRVKTGVEEKSGYA